MTRIIFVDDEIYILEGFKRAMRNKSAVWDMNFCNSGQEAVELIQKSMYDIIVTDNKMPEMNGIELLSRVKEISPGTKRILLTGYTEDEILNKSRDTIDLIISKPIEPDSLINILEETIKSN